MRMLSTSDVLDRHLKSFAERDLDRCVDGDYAYILWTAETVDNSYEFATDTFLVQKGKIVAQSFAAKIKPRR